jgi:GT2 family glycosyltransferase
MEHPATVAGREETLGDLLRWRRISTGLRYLRRHGVRATLRRLFPSLRSYRAWIADCDTLTREDVQAIRRHISVIAEPLISVMMPVRGDQAVLAARSAATLVAQLYPRWDLHLVAEPAAAESLLALTRGDARIKLAVAGVEGGIAAAINVALTSAAGELVALVDPGDELAPHAFYLLAAELSDHSDAGLVYSDEDSLDARGRRQNPQFKSDWNPELLLGCDMIGRLAAYRRGLIKRLGGLQAGFDGAAEYDLALRASELLSPAQIRHLPYVLYHRRAATYAPRIAAAQRRALSEYFARTGKKDIEVLPGPTGETHRIIRPLPRQPPLVSLVVPVGAGTDLVRNCLAGILSKTDYDRLELLVMVNAGTKPEVVPYLEQIATDPRVTIIDTQSGFNFSRICNLGIGRARGDIIGLINDDLEVIEPGWLREMVSHAVRPEVGAVGAKLYYPDDTIQHAGVIIAPGGGASHWFRHARRDEAGYCNRLLITQDLSAVTAACMLLRKVVYSEIGGLDEINLAVAFNDVDLCLRIRERGYLIVWTPFAELYHMESASRGSDLAPDKIDRFRREVAFLAKKWAASFPNDPYYNPNLALHNDRPDLAFPPRVIHPWLAARS